MSVSTVRVVDVDLLFEFVSELLSELELEIEFGERFDVGRGAVAVAVNAA